MEPKRAGFKRGLWFHSKGPFAHGSIALWLVHSVIHSPRLSSAPMPDVPPHCPVLHIQRGPRAKPRSALWNCAGSSTPPSGSHSNGSRRISHRGRNAAAASGTYARVSGGDTLRRRRVGHGNGEQAVEVRPQRPSSFFDKGSSEEMETARREGTLSPEYGGMVESALT